MQIALSREFHRVTVTTVKLDFYTECKDLLELDGRERSLQSPSVLTFRKWQAETHRSEVTHHRKWI